MLRVLLFVGLIALNLYAFVLCAQTEQEQIQRLPKWAWLVIIVIFQSLGSVAYLIWGRPKNPGPGRGGKRKVIGPDDDPDFLRNL
jgi:hypothetical protein